MNGWALCLRGAILNPAAAAPAPILWRRWTCACGFEGMSPGEASWANQVMHDRILPFRGRQATKEVAEQVAAAAVEVACELVAAGLPVPPGTFNVVRVGQEGTVRLQWEPAAASAADGGESRQVAAEEVLN